MIGVSFFLALCGSMHAASQLSPFYESLLKYRETGAIPPTVDLSKVVPSEEIPVIIGALNSGNAVLMDAAVLDARSILQIHSSQGRSKSRSIAHVLGHRTIESEAQRPVIAKTMKLACQ
jgi:hypothetical protein